MSAPFSAMLDVPSPFSTATWSVTAIPCTRAVLLLSFPKESFASHAKPVLHNSESVNIKKKENKFPLILENFERYIKY